MPDHSRRLRLVEFIPDSTAAEPAARTDAGQVDFLHEWRAAQIARSKAMHPSTLARAAVAPALRPLG